MKRVGKRTLIVNAVALSLSVLATGAQAEYPEDAVTIVVNSSPGGGADTLTRTLAEALSREFGNPVVVENKPGAGGNIAGSLVKRKAADGYTLLMGDSGMLTINPSLYDDMPFDPAKDFDAITAVAQFPIVMAANPDAGIANLAELVEKAKAEPGKINYASTGIGSPQHLTSVLLQSATGIELNHVPYKGGANALVDMIAGRVDIGFVGIPPTAPRVRNGELVGLGVTTAARSKLLPDTPAIAETVPGFETSVWFGLLAPKGTPDEVKRAIKDAVAAVMKDEELQARLAGLGYAPMADSVDDMSVFMASETAQWKSAVDQSGAKVD